MRVIASAVLLLIATSSLLGCTGYDANYYDVAANQWQHMPSNQQDPAIYAYNAGQTIKAQNQTTLHIAGLELP